MKAEHSKFNSFLRCMLVWNLTIAPWHVATVSASTLLGDVVRSSVPNENTAFGYSLSISGETAAVGEWFDTGVVNILQLDSESGNWQEVQRITTPAEQSGQVNFGFSTWLDGDQLVVGAPNILQSSPGAVSGYAYIYERNPNDGVWTLAGTIAGKRAAEGEFPSGRLGREVVIDQGHAMISRQNDDQTATVLIYEEALTGEWIESQSLAIGYTEGGQSDTTTVNSDISALALDNGRLMVGIDESDENQVSTFAIQSYELNPSIDSWVESFRIDQFGTVIGGSTPPGLALENDRLLMTGESGAFVFKRDAQTGQWLQDELFREDVTIPVSNERQASDIEGNRVVVTGRDGVGVLVYERDGLSGRWNETAELSTALLTEDSPTITAVDLQGDHVLVGLPYVDDFTGAVLAFRLDDPDSDGIAAVDDNCPLQFNPMQSNFDDDLLGDVCDLDDDNDNVPDDRDAFPFDPNRQQPVDPNSSEAPETPFPAWPFGTGIPLETDFRWPAVNNATYYVIEVQHDESIRAYEPGIPATIACNATQCDYIKTDAVLNGENRWRLRAGNSAGVSDWSPWSDFFVGQLSNPPVGDAAFRQQPAVPTPQQTPDGSIALDIDYVWAAVPGVIHYAIEIQHQGNIRAYEPSLPASEACFSGVCRYVKTDAALTGDNRWRLRAINDVGDSAWSAWAEFSVEADQSTPSTPDAFVPAEPVPISPVGTTELAVSHYQWAAVDGATVYSVEIQHAGRVRGYADDILPSEVCSTSDCVFSKSDAALPGENRWRVRSGNTNGFSQWSEWQIFTR